MARLRNLGQMAQILLQARLRSKAQEDSDERQLANSKILADYSSGLRSQERDDQFDLDTTKLALGDPTGGIAQRMGLNKLVPSQAQRQAPLMTEIGQADSMEKLPSKETFLARLAATPGGINSLPEFTQGLNAIDSQKEKIGLQQEQAMDRTGATAYQQSFNQGKGTEAATADAFPAKLERDVKAFERMTPLELGRLRQEEGIKAQIDLKKQKDLYTFQLAQAGRMEEAKQLSQMTTDASVSISAIQELAALAAEVNKGYGPGADVYAGIRDAYGTLPYLGAGLRQGMTTAAGTSAAVFGGDPSLIRKAQRLEAMRNDAARKFIVAAGDPRPSDADLAGMLPLFPGAFESEAATTEKTQYILDATKFLPELAAANPGVRGKALFDMAFAKAKEVSVSRAHADTPSQQPIAKPLSPGLEAIMNR